MCIRFVLALALGWFAGNLSLLVAQLPPPQELHYSGSLVEFRPDGKSLEVKSFQVLCCLFPHETTPLRVCLVDESGGGSWSWPERLAGFSSPPADSPAPPPIRLLHTHDNSPHPITLHSPFFLDLSKLASGSKWIDGNRNYAVTESITIMNQPGWQVEVTGEVGRKITLQVTAADGIVHSARQTLFLGRGDRFEAAWHLDSQKSLEPDAAAKARTFLDALRPLLEELHRPADATDPDLSEEQLALAEDRFPQIEKLALGTSFETYALGISRDLSSQRNRATKVGDLAKRFLGKPAPEFELTSLDGKPVDPETLRDRFIVLHFWEYRGEPLKEPYGQIGYLDFLHERRRKLGVSVFGVAVDERLSNPQTAQQSVRSINELREFMNTSYPITRDDGALLKLFGNPKRLGQPLPLWVVLDRNRNVVHYKVGFYDVDPQRGLKELDDVLVKLIRDARNTSAANKDLSTEKKESEKNETPSNPGQ